VILLDIEGTTTPLAFVTRTLFPYARAHLPRFLERHGGSPEVAAVLERLHAEYETDRREDADVPTWSPIGYAEWLMDRDRKPPALKDLQGRVWEEGYEAGQLTGEVFADVPPALERWRAAGIPAGIFSSGSVLAQQWLFRRSSAGDLTPFLRWYFDTGAGPKQEAGSYGNIAAAVGIAAPRITFVSDVVRELDAARAAGMRTVLTDRPGNASQPPHDHRVVRSFDEIP
jgi:enolase-phosphatase E1